MEESDRKCREHEESQKAKEEEKAEVEATDAAAGDSGDKGNSEARFVLSQGCRSNAFKPVKLISKEAVTCFAGFCFVSGGGALWYTLRTY